MRGEKFRKSMRWQHRIGVVVEVIGCVFFALFIISVLALFQYMVMHVGG